MLLVSLVHHVGDSFQIDSSVVAAALLFVSSLRSVSLCLCSDVLGVVHKLYAYKLANNKAWEIKLDFFVVAWIWTLTDSHLEKGITCHARALVGPRKSLLAASCVSWCSAQTNKPKTKDIYLFGKPEERSKQQLFVVANNCFSLY